MDTVAIISFLASILTIITVFWSFLKLKLISQRLRFYSHAEIKRATQCYIRPHCQRVDPGYSEGNDDAKRDDLFSYVNQFLIDPLNYKYAILLGDTGTGKTSFLLNYYAYHNSWLRRWRFRLEIVPLSIKNAEKAIESIKFEHRRKTVLFLDALDEDVKAADGRYQQRVIDLCEITREFRHVLFTCRTQFFPKAIEEPCQTGVIKIAPIKPGEQSGHEFHKRYLSPFDNKQISRYVNCRFARGKRHLRQIRRKRAQDLISKITQLSIRPMILSYIDDLLQIKEDEPFEDISYSFQLYEKIVEAWLRREIGRAGITEVTSLREFSEELAIELFGKRQQHGGERLIYEEVEPLAHKWGVKIADWKLTSRSLLNRDAEDYYKFAHRSIMEYLFVKKFLKLPIGERPELAWTEQMNRFLLEIIQYNSTQKALPKVDIRKADLLNLAITAEITVVKLRSQPKELSESQVIKMLKELSFFDAKYNASGQGIANVLIASGSDEDSVVIDLTLIRPPSVKRKNDPDRK